MMVRELDNLIYYNIVYYNYNEPIDLNNMKFMFDNILFCDKSQYLELKKQLNKI